MVRNTQGGNRQKGAARKGYQTSAAHQKLRVSEDPSEIYAQAVRVLGGSLASAVDLSGNPLLVHIRGRFRGRHKSSNFVGPGVWLLVGLHEFSSRGQQAKARSCDLLEVYTAAEQIQLKTSYPSIAWFDFGVSTDTKDEVEFMDAAASDGDEKMMPLNESELAGFQDDAMETFHGKMIDVNDI